ncbi:unnamed protein product, partial [marine sediment metagenome]
FFGFGFLFHVFGYFFNFDLFIILPYLKQNPKQMLGFVKILKKISLYVFPFLKNPV